MGLNHTSTALALVSSTVLLIASLFLDYASSDKIAEHYCTTIGYSNASAMTYCVGWDNAYAISVASVGMVISTLILLLLSCKPVVLVKAIGSLKLPKIGAVTVDLVLSSFLFAWLTVGAFVLTTMTDHGFNQLSNGYFACWAGSITSLGNLGADQAAIVRAGPVFGLLVASSVVLIQSTLTLEIHYIRYAFIISVISLVITAVFMLYNDRIEAKCKGRISGFLKISLLLLWVIEAMWTTFPAESPFHIAGNGYFGSWMAVCMAAKFATIQSTLAANMNLLSKRASKMGLMKSTANSKSATSVEWTPTTSQALGDGDIVEAPVEDPIGGPIAVDSTAEDTPKSSSEVV